MEEDGLGGTCGTHSGNAYSFFAWQTRRKRSNFEDLSVDGRVILKWILMKLDGRG